MQAIDFENRGWIVCMGFACKFEIRERTNMNVNKTHFRIGQKGDEYVFAKEYDTREAAVDEASDRAAAEDAKFIIYQAIAEIKPERAPVAVVPLG